MVIESIRKTKDWKCESSTIWCKPDQDISERVENGVLFGIKYFLKSWGYPHNCIWVDVASKTISCGQEKVATVSVTGTELSVVFGEGWDSWEGFQTDATLLDILEKARAKLSKSTDTKGKGKGKTIS